jgi:hypothetical protein
MEEIVSRVGHWWYVSICRQAAPRTEKQLEGRVCFLACFSGRCRGGVNGTAIGSAWEMGITPERIFNGPAPRSQSPSVWPSAVFSFQGKSNYASKKKSNYSYVSLDIFFLEKTNKHSDETKASCLIILWNLVETCDLLGICEPLFLNLWENLKLNMKKIQI